MARQVASPAHALVCRETTVFSASSLLPGSPSGYGARIGHFSGRGRGRIVLSFPSHERSLAPTADTPADAAAARDIVGAGHEVHSSCPWPPAR
jgi:hypothetical protein